MPFVESDKNLNQLCTFVISSCDAYKDLWTPYFNLKTRFWPDCPFRTVLISESIKTEIKDVETFNTGQHLSWSAMLRKTIEAVKTPFVLLSMEDFFFQSKVDSAKVENLLDYVIGEDISMLRLIPRPGPNMDLQQDANLGKISMNANYRVSGQASFWKSEVLLDLLDDSESLWEFEINATKRSQKYDGFVSVIKPIFTYKHHVIERGKWFPWSALKFKRMNIGVDLKSREVMGFIETVVWCLKKTLTPIWLVLPTSIRAFLKRFLIS